MESADGEGGADIRFIQAMMGHAKLSKKRRASLQRRSMPRRDREIYKWKVKGSSSISEVMAPHMTEYSYTVLFEPAEEGGYVVILHPKIVKQTLEIIAEAAEPESQGD